MATDPFTTLGRIASAPWAFPPASGAAQVAVRKFATTAVLATTMTLDDLTVIASVIGDDLEDALSGLKPSDAVTVVRRLDPHGPKPTPADGVPRLLRLARGGAPAKAPPPPEPVVRIETLDLDGLRSHAAAKGDGFAAWLKGQPAAKVKAALGKVDKAYAVVVPGNPEAIKDRLIALASGAHPVSSLKPSEVTLDTLVALRRDGPATFDAWTKWGEAKDAAPTVVARLDPAFPNVARIAKVPAMARLRALVDGSAPFPSADVDALDVDGLRKARSEMGDQFAAWLKALPPERVKAALVRLDPHRPKVGALKPREYPFLIGKIADGGHPVAAETEGRVLGERAFPVRS